jgi:eukaryotic-like serine/threonine-protein kinase
VFGPNVDLVAELRGALPSPRYSVDGPLGAGGQGSVFRGSCDGQPAAIKLFAPTTDQRRVDREIELLKNLRCDYVVRVLGSEKARIMSSDVSVIAYELHDGGDLRCHLDNAASSLDAGTVGRIGRQIGTALDALWANRIVHRDVKPANIVTARDGRFVLVDVGFARFVDRSALSGAGVVPGTPGFMAPEQCSGRRNLTVHADAFSLGITLYFLAAKRHPFGGQQAAIMTRLVPERLHKVRPDLPEPLCKTIDRFLSLRPSNRPRDLGVEFANF